MYGVLKKFKTDEINKEVITKSKYTKRYEGHKKKEKRELCHDFDLNSVDSLESLESGESLLEHARKCPECKKKLMDLIKKYKKKREK